MLAAIALVVSLVGSERAQSLASRSRVTAEVTAWIVVKAASVRALDAVAAPMMILAMVAWTMGIQRLFAKGAVVSREEWRPNHGEMATALYLIACAAVVEEFVFRGVVLSAVSFYTSVGWGLGISAVLFGLLHFEKGFGGALVVMGYGAILGGGLVLGCSLLACVVAHAAGNALALFLPRTLVGVEEPESDSQQ
ncbi:MAG: CPBP family intramembrane glutamic endopeptidase [Candidatus Eisenbacteria bacterium]